MTNIKKPLITRIVGNGHALGFAARRACSLLIAIIFLFTGTGYSANGPLKLRPALQFSKMWRETIKGIVAPDKLQAIDDVTIERIDSIHHDFTGRMQVIIDVVRTVKKLENIEDPLRDLCGRIFELLAQLAKDSLAIRNYKKGDKKKDISKNIRSYLSASKDFFEALSPENILLLKEKYSKGVEVKDAAKKDKQSEYLWLFENVSKGIRMILATNADLLPQGTKQVDVHGLLDTALGVEIAGTSNRNLVRDYAANPIFVDVNEGELFRVFINLLRNAKEVLRGGVGTVETKTSIRNDFAIVAIKDNGEGMSEDSVVAFNAGQAVISNKGEGHGQGLNIVRDLVKRNGGTIEVASELGKGTTFTIRLPIVQGRQPESIKGSGIEASRNCL